MKVGIVYVGYVNPDTVPISLCYLLSEFRASIQLHCRSVFDLIAGEGSKELDTGEVVRLKALPAKASPHALTLSARLIVHLTSENYSSTYKSPAPGT